MPLPAAIVSQITRRAFISTELIELELPVPIYLTAAPYDITQQTPTSNGFKTYVAQGSFLSYTGIGLVDTIRVNSIQITLAGASSNYIQYLLNEQFLHRPIRIYKQFIEQRIVVNQQSTFIPPVLIYEGVMTGASMTEDGKQSTITLNTNNQFYDFDRKNGRRTNPASQKRYYPNDKGMDFSTINIADIQWGTFRD
jgi:hypothetical protein